MSEEKKLARLPRTFSLTVTTDVIKLVDENPTRKALLVVNLGANTVYILSAQNLKYTDGIPITNGGSYSNDHCYGAYWIVAATGSNDVRVEENCE